MLKQKLAALLLPLALTAIPITAKAETPLNLPADITTTTLPSSTSITTPSTTKIHFGVGYRYVDIGDDTNAYLNQTRAMFKDSMPGFDKFLDLSRNLPHIALGVSTTLPLHILGNDTIEALVSNEFSSSAIFGTVKSEKNFPASVQYQDIKFDLGDTPTTWEQKLTIYDALVVGFKYTPFQHSLKPFVKLNVGLSYLISESDLHIHVNGNNTTDFFGWDTLNFFNIFQDIHTTDRMEGWGYIIDPKVGVTIAVSEKIALEIAAGYRIEPVRIKLKEHTKQDKQQHDKTVHLNYSAGGPSVTVHGEYKF